MLTHFVKVTQQQGGKPWFKPRESDFRAHTLNRTSNGGTSDDKHRVVRERELEREAFPHLSNDSTEATLSVVPAAREAMMPL